MTFIAEVVGFDVDEVGIEGGLFTQSWPLETIFIGNIPCFTLMSMEANCVGSDTFIPNGALP